MGMKNFQKYILSRPLIGILGIPVLESLLKSKAWLSCVPSNQTDANKPPSLRMLECSGRQEGRGL